MTTTMLLGFVAAFAGCGSVDRELQALRYRVPQVTSLEDPATTLSRSMSFLPKLQQMQKTWGEEAAGPPKIDSLAATGSWNG